MNQSIHKLIKNKEQMISIYHKYQALLSNRQKNIFYLHYFEDLGLTDIAKILASSRQSVYDGLKKAEKKLIDLEEKIGKLKI
ncbi:MAG: hypothetical protein E7Y34_00620 [Mycoplasma sp.]|nr:hypothetical protein [Mycoplasma sp.]